MSSSEEPTHPLPIKNIALIIGFTRTKILDRAPPSPVITTKVTVVDLASFNLPVFNEPVIPAMVPARAQFTHQHSKDWSAEVAKYDGYIIVSAEYNYGVPGALKNAIDYLYSSWIGKPVLLVSYGIFGGKLASESLKRSLEGMHLVVCGTRVLLDFPGRDEANQNMSPGLLAAIGGKLDESVVEIWEASYTEDVLKGWEELRGLVARKEVVKG